MSICTAKVALRGSFVALVILSFAVLAGESVAQVETASPTRMATFEKGGETTFALSIGPERQESQRASDVIVFVDTSASQTGLYKKDSIELLSNFVRNLSGDDRVRIFAIDLEPIALFRDFTHPLDDKIQVAIDNLNNRVALGSTDMESMIEAAIESFPADETRNRNVVYIGDGISRAGVLHTEVFTKAVKSLAKNHISVSSFAIGPDRNMALLAALANHTGGNIVIDSDAADSVSNGAVSLAKTVHGSVFWPKGAKLPENLTEVYPAICPPMRSDRDTILVGSVSDRDALAMELTGIMDGKEVTKAWNVSPESVSDKFSFLPKMLTEARKDGGVSLPTVGSAGLIEYARVIDESAIDLELLSDNNVQNSGTAVIASAANKADRRVAVAARYRKQEGDDPFGGSTDADPFGSGEGSGEDPFGSSDPAPAPAEDPFGGAAPAAPEPTPAPAEDPFGSAAPAPEPAPAPVQEPIVDDPFGGAPEPAPAPAPAQDPIDDPFGSSTKPEEPSEDTGQLGPVDDSAMEIASPEIEAPLIEEPAPLQIAPNQQQPGVVVPDFVEVQPLPPSVIIEGTPAPIRQGTPPSDISRLLLQTEREYLREEVLDIEQRDRIINEKLRKQVQFETERALQELSIDPTAAIDRLKNMLEVVDQTPELTQGTVAELRSRLESALLSATRRKLDFDQRQQLSSQNVATVNAIRNDILNYERNEEKLARLIAQYESLLREGNYEVSERVSDSLFEAFPDSPDAVAISERGRIARNHFEFQKFRSVKQNLFIASVREIQKSSYPIPGNPPLVFPDPEEWIQKKADRAKYQNVRLAGGENERRIIEQLENPIDLVYDAEPFGDVKETLSRDLGINIVIDANLEGVLDDDTEVTANLVGISLGRGLRTMLKAVDATYVVKDEVLLVISIDDELEPDFLVTDVYNVGDLVAPRSAPGGGFGGGLGGARGARGNGFGGGNLGGGAGGLGGGGGLGGAFCIQDAPAGFYIGDEKTRKPAAKSATPKGSVSFKPGNLIDVKAGDDPAKAWNDYFKNNEPTSKSVRATVRHMVSQQRHEEIVALINAAILNDQADASWMFQALGISMQITGRPTSETERAIMSAVDLSDSFEDSMFAAIYMSKSGMVDRSLRVLKDLAKANPSLVQPLEVGSSIAENNNHLEGMRWTSVGVLSQEWPDKPELIKRARFAAAAVKAELEKAGDSEQVAEFEKELADAKHRDCFVEVSWTGDADIDVLVEEPGGTICSRLNPRTTAGGVYFGDTYSTGKAASGSMKEQYVLPKGFSGDYRLIIRRMVGEVTSGKVNVAIHNHYQSDYEASLERAVKLDPQGAIVLFKLSGGRRTDDLDQHTLETLVQKKLAAKQSAVAQHMASFVTRQPAILAQTGVGIAGDDFFGGGGVGGGTGGGVGQNNRFNPGVVGYSPQIEQIPSGTFLNVNHATTADRLYVLISATPNFLTITEVTTFNILGNAGNAQGAGQGGGGGGFGGGLGGGGGGIF